MTPDSDPLTSAASSPDVRGRALAELIPPLVHDMNNKLAVLRGFCELEEAGGNPLVEPAKREAAEAARILARLSTFSKQHGDGRESFDVAATVRDLSCLLRPLALSRKVELSIEADGSMIVDGHAARLEQFLIGLVVADVAACSPARLRIRARRHPRRVTITVAHDGQGGALTAPVMDGVAARARASQGARALRLTLDCAEAIASSAPIETASGARILVVDSHGDSAELIAAVLDEAGYRVDVVPDAATARERLSGDSFELVLTDGILTGPALGVDANTALARIGEPGSDGLPCVPAAVRPDELLDFVRTCLR